MKNNIFGFLLVIISLFASCATTKINFDDNVPDDETAIIQPSVSIIIVEFNGKRVDWQAGTWSGTEITIPSGEANLIVGIAIEKGNYLYTGGRLSFAYNFIKGHKYYLICRDIFVKENEADIEIRDTTTATREVIRAKNS